MKKARPEWHCDTMTDDELARYLARRIFEAPYGCEPDQVQRIQFRGHGESDMGGFCESALAEHILAALQEAEDRDG